MLRRTHLRLLPCHPWASHAPRRPCLRNRQTNPHRPRPRRHRLRSRCRRTRSASNQQLPPSPTPQRARALPPPPLPHSSGERRPHSIPRSRARHPPDSPPRRRVPQLPPSAAPPLAARYVRSLRLAQTRARAKAQQEARNPGRRLGSGRCQRRPSRRRSRRWRWWRRPQGRRQRWRPDQRHVRRVQLGVSSSNRPLASARTLHRSPPPPSMLPTRPSLPQAPSPRLPLPRCPPPPAPPLYQPAAASARRAEPPRHNLPLRVPLSLSTATARAPRLLRRPRRAHHRASCHAPPLPGTHLRAQRRLWSRVWAPSASASCSMSRTWCSSSSREARPRATPCFARATSCWASTGRCCTGGRWRGCSSRARRNTPLSSSGTRGQSRSCSRLSLVQQTTRRARSALMAARGGLQSQRGGVRPRLTGARRHQPLRILRMMMTVTVQPRARASEAEAAAAEEEARAGWRAGCCKRVSRSRWSTVRRSPRRLSLRSASSRPLPSSSSWTSYATWPPPPTSLWT